MDCKPDRTHFARQPAIGLIAALFLVPTPALGKPLPVAAAAALVEQNVGLDLTARWGTWDPANATGGDPGETQEESASQDDTLTKRASGYAPAARIGVYSIDDDRGPNLYFHNSWYDPTLAEGEALAAIEAAAQAIEAAASQNQDGAEAISEIALPISEIARPISEIAQPTSEVAQPISEVAEPSRKAPRVALADAAATPTAMPTAIQTATPIATPKATTIAMPLATPESAEAAAQEPIASIAEPPVVPAAAPASNATPSDLPADEAVERSEFAERADTADAEAAAETAVAAADPEPATERPELTVASASVATAPARVTAVASAGPVNPVAVTAEAMVPATPDTRAGTTVAAVIAEVRLPPLARSTSDGAAPAAGQTQITRHASWATVCVERDEQGPAACRLETRLQDARTRQTLFRWQIGYADDGRLLSVAQTPNGVLLSAGLELDLTDLRATRLPFSTCTDAACESAFFMEGQLIDTLSARDAVSARFVTADGEPIELAVSMQGFATALGELTP